MRYAIPVARDAIPVAHDTIRVARDGGNLHLSGTVYAEFFSISLLDISPPFCLSYF